MNEQDILIMKAEVYDLNKAMQKMNGVLSRIAQILEIKEGAALEQFFTAAEEAMQAVKVLKTQQKMEEAKVYQEKAPQ